MKIETAKEFFHDYWNNYLTVERIADDYGITEKHARELIEKGREDWNRDAAIEKMKTYGETLGK